MATIRERLNETLRDLVTGRDDVVVIGEDIADPYGGAFKITDGLTTLRPNRVFTTPVSEAAIVGLGIGLALRGYRPVVEIMFGDFITLAADQLINHAAKMTWMYGEDLSLPLVARAPMGGRRRYGPTHSQSLERLFLGVPGLGVAAVSPLLDPGRVLTHAVTASNRPLVLIENKALYGHPVLTGDDLKARGFGMETGEGGLPAVVVSPEALEPDITFVAYGGMSPLALDAAERLRAEEDLICEVVVIHRLAPLDIAPIRTSLLKTRRLVVMEEGPVEAGWGAEVIAGLAEVALEAPARRVGAANLPVPAAGTLEDAVLPGVTDIMAAAIATVDETYS